MHESKEKKSRKKTIKKDVAAKKGIKETHLWKNHFPVSFMFLKKYFSLGKLVRRSILIVITVIFLFSILLMHYSFSPIDRNNKTVVFDIPSGASFLEITEILNSAGLIKSRFFFYSLSIMKGARRHICSGEYEINTSLTPWTMVHKLMRGEVREYKVLIPEDFTMKEIANRLDDEKLINKEIFFDLAGDKEFLESLNIKADSIEGYLFPDTYNFTRSMNTRQIMKRMVDTFWKKVSPSMLEKADEMGLNPHQFITLASIIGKESGNDSEKPLIAAVFHNRLKKGMRLQSDPTAVYDLDDFAGKVVRSHLRRKSPYNTYVIKGLPPGPIANPGLASLQATLNPAKADYLYFVYQNDGSHFFSSTLVEHNKAVNRFIYQKNHPIQVLKKKSSDKKE